MLKLNLQLKMVIDGIDCAESFILCFLFFSEKRCQTWRRTNHLNLLRHGRKRSRSNALNCTAGFKHVNKLIESCVFFVIFDHTYVIFLICMFKVAWENFILDVLLIKIKNKIKYNLIFCSFPILLLNSVAKLVRAWAVDK